MKILLILHGNPADSEASFNSLRLAAALATRPNNQVRTYLMSDAVALAVPRAPESVAKVLEKLLSTGQATIGVCGSCMDARSVLANDLMEGAKRGTLEQLADWTEWSDKLISA